MVHKYGDDVLDDADRRFFEVDGEDKRYFYNTEVDELESWLSKKV